MAYNSKCSELKVILNKVNDTLYFYFYSKTGVILTMKKTQKCTFFANLFVQGHTFPQNMCSLIRFIQHLSCFVHTHNAKSLFPFFRLKKNSQNKLQISRLFHLLQLFFPIPKSITIFQSIFIAYIPKHSDYFYRNNSFVWGQVF